MAGESSWQNPASHCRRWLPVSESSCSSGHAGRSRRRRWLLKRPRFHVHFTPTSASWLNLVERWFSALTDKQLRRNSFQSTRELEAAIRTYLDLYNQQHKPFVWTKSADQILDSIARYCRRINDSPH